VPARENVAAWLVTMLTKTSCQRIDDDRFQINFKHNDGYGFRIFPILDHNFSVGTYKNYPAFAQSLDSKKIIDGKRKK
jgi:hypothetical protein